MSCQRLVRRFGGREFARLDAEGTAVAKADQEDRPAHPEVQLRDRAVEDISKEGHEPFMRLGPHKEMDAGAEAANPGSSGRLEIHQ